MMTCPALKAERSGGGRRAATGLHATPGGRRRPEPFRRAGRFAGAVLVASLLTGCADRSGGGVTADQSAAENWMALYQQRDFFSLRDALAAAGPAAAADPQLQFLRAAVQHAFNRPAASEEALAAVLEHGEATALLRRQALLLRLQNLVRLFRYDDAARVADQLLSLPDGSLSQEQRADVSNMRKLTLALAGVPPQRLVARAPVVLDYGSDGRVDMRIGEFDLRVPFDTGANLSVLMRSEAGRLGVEIRPAGIEVGTSTDMKVSADLGVARRVQIGPLEFSDVVFLVFPDELLTFPDGYVIEGIIGFPLIEAMGEVRFRRGGLLEIPAEVSAGGDQNLALDQLEPLVRVGYEDEWLVCRLDTGADDTVFYEPFYRRHAALFEPLGSPTEERSGGVGGIRSVQAYTLPEIAFELGGARVVLNAVRAYTTPITDQESNDLDCNIGRTAVADFAGYTINFRSMSLVAMER